MKGFDPRVLIRYLVGDDPAQSPRANKFIEKLTVQGPGFVRVMVIAEVARVLRSRYIAKPLEIADGIEQVLSIDRLMVQNEQQVYQAVVALRAGEGTVADALICAIGFSASCTKTLAFDDLSRLSHFEVV